MPRIDFRTIAVSVAIYLGAPLAAAVITRYGLIAAAGERWYNQRFLPAFGPVALLALIYTVRPAAACGALAASPLKHRSAGRCR